MQKPFDLNPFTKLWRMISSSQILEHQILEYIKLVELAIVQVIGIVKDERCFSTFTFMKNKQRNWLTMDLELVIQMFSQKFFTMENLPFGTTIQSWKDNKFVMRNDGGVIEFYNWPLFSWSMLVWIWCFMNFHPTPFSGCQKSRVRTCFFTLSMHD